MHRLSAKIGFVVAAVAAVLLFVVRIAGVPFTFWVGAGLTLGVGVAGYGAAYRLLAARIELARSTLKQIRKHQFENLEAAHLPRGDELNALIWQVYRTGLALEKEIRGLRKMENYRREYLGNVSHELKTPIFAIQGFAETLLGGGLDDERFRRSFVEKILRNAGRLNNLAQDLSEIARIETGELKMTMEPFDLRQLVHEVAESLELAAGAKEVRLRHRLADGLPAVVGDRERIRQVLVNLVDNAIKYNNPGGHVDVAARRLGGGDVKIEVSDDGIGLAPQDIHRVTERFYRVDKSRSRYQGGTGLGLAIVKHILAAHERKLLIESTLGQGSTFAFTLPAAPGGAPAVRP